MVWELLDVIFTSRNDCVKIVMNRTAPHSPFSLLRSLYFQRHYVSVASVAVFRSVMFSCRISNWMYTEISTKVFVEIFNLKDENNSAS